MNRYTLRGLAAVCTHCARIDRFQQIEVSFLSESRFPDLLAHKWFSLFFLAGAGGHIALLLSRWSWRRPFSRGGSRTAPDDLLARLRAHGIVATSQQSVMDLSKQYGVRPNRLLAIVFLNN
jgi:hypothetical protein